MDMRKLLALLIFNNAIQLKPQGLSKHFLSVYLFIFADVFVVDSCEQVNSNISF